MPVNWRKQQTELKREGFQGNCRSLERVWAESGLHQSHRTELYWEHPGGYLLIEYRSGFVRTCISGMSLKVTQDRIMGSDMTLYH